MAYAIPNQQKEKKPSFWQQMKDIWKRKNKDKSSKDTHFVQEMPEKAEVKYD